MSQPTQHLYEFGPFRLDARERLLQRDGATIALTPKAFDLLLALVERHGRLVEKEELLKLVWPDAFVEEANLTYNISFIRKALGDGENGLKFIETVPKRGYRFVVGVREIEENGAEKVRQSKTAKTSASPRPRVLPSPRWLLAISIGSLALVLSLYYSWNQRATAPAPIKEIAVLPLRPLQLGDRDEVLEMGAASMLITRLSSLRQLIVRPESAVNRYARPDQDPLAAGREQKVDAVLDSRYQRSGNKFRFTLRLLRVADGATLWADTLDQPAADLFALQDALSGQVTSALRLTLSDAEKALMAKRYTNSTEAWQHYVRGRHLVHMRNKPDTLKAITYFERAIKLDPNFALAYTQLGFAQASMSYLGQAPSKEVMPKAKEAIERALKLDDQLAETHSALASYKAVYEWDFKSAEQEYQRALDLDPNSAKAHLDYGFYLTFMGRFEQAIREVRRAEELDPVDRFITVNVAQYLYFARRYDEAIEQSNRVIDLYPNWGNGYNFLVNSYREKKDEQKTFEAIVKQQEVFGAGAEEITRVKADFAREGLKGIVRGELNDLLEQEKSGYIQPFQLARRYAYLGQKEEAFAWLQKMVEDRPFFVVLLKVEPEWDSLRDDPRFVALLRRVGLLQ